ncbi:MAG: ion transporter [Magnetospiraceae bacterium]
MSNITAGFFQRAGRFAESPGVQRVIMVLILINALTLGLETVPAIVTNLGWLLHGIDAVVLTVFVAEIAAKLGYRRWVFFKNGWNIFDFIIVGIALIPASGPLSVLRALRILRVLRLMSVVPQMRRVIGALFSAIPGISSVGAIILLIFYVSAVLTTKYFGEAFPQWFGTLGESLFSLFQIMTLESWSEGIVRPVMQVYPYAWIFFVPFILITSFAILNLFIGIIVDAMQTQHEEVEAAVHADARDLESDIAELRREIRALRALLQENRPAP